MLRQQEVSPVSYTHLDVYKRQPFGDICILVTADRITAGALIAETAEETLVSNCFALATISSDVEHVETYACLLYTSRCV